MALTAGGTCWIGPVSAAAAAFTAVVSSPAAGTAAVTSPSASPVPVACPSLIVARYSFSVSARCPSSLVAFSSPTTSTPVAIGSSVPAWPTRRVPASRRILATTSWEVQPEGLSAMISPLGAVTAASGPHPAASRTGPRRVRRARLRDEFLQVGGALGEGVADERQRRRVPQPRLPPDLGADEPGRALERRRGRRLLLRRPVHRVVDGRLAQVVGDAGIG